MSLDTKRYTEDRVFLWLLGTIVFATVAVLGMLGYLAYAIGHWILSH